MSMNDYRTIVVGTDGSPLATPTITRAAWLAVHEDSDLVVVCAYSGLSQRDAARSRTLGAAFPSGEAQGRKEAGEALAAAVTHATELGATVRAGLLVEGDPAEALLSAVRDYDADLLVVGARQDVSIAERLLGTVASEVVRKARCEVLVVRPREDRPDPSDS